MKLEETGGWRGGGFKVDGGEIKFSKENAGRFDKGRTRKCSDMYRGL